MARYSGMFSKMRLKGDLAKLAGDSLTQSERDYLASAVAGQEMLAGYNPEKGLSEADVANITMDYGMEGGTMAQDLATRGTYSGETDY
jgi:hypothetical protein